MGAFQLSQTTHWLWPIISLVSFVIAVLHYAMDVDGGNGGEPEEIVLGDRVAQVPCAQSILTLIAAVYQ